MSFIAAAYLAATIVLQQSGTPDSLTLGQALARARAERPRGAMAGAMVDRARGAQRVTTVIPNPVSQVETDDFAPTNKLTVTQSLGWLTRRGAEAAAGRAGVNRASADSAQTIADLGQDVRRSFFGALAAQQQLQLAVEQATVADSLTRIADRRAEAGDISDLERDQVAQEGGRARLAASQARESARIARFELARAVAWASGRAVVAAGALDEGLDNHGLLLVPANVSTVPLVRAALADSAASDARLRSARIARVPIPGIVAGREWGGVEPIGAPRTANLILGLSMPLPLWSQGNEAVAEARAVLALNASQLAETRLSAIAQLDGARARVEETVARAHFARDSLLPQARRIRAGAVRLYDAGRTGVVPVLDALRAERDVARAAIAELLAFQHARADLTALLGRWE